MDDVIYRQAAIDYCYQLINVEHEQGSDEMNYGRERVNQTETILHHLELMPSAQPALVRCKDCKYYEIWQLKSDYTEDKRYKPSVCVQGQYAVRHKPDWFCADAERREDGEQSD